MNHPATQSSHTNDTREQNYKMGNSRKLTDSLVNRKHNQHQCTIAILYFTNSRVKQFNFNDDLRNNRALTGITWNAHRIILNNINTNSQRVHEAISCIRILPTTKSNSATRQIVSNLKTCMSACMVWMERTLFPVFECVLCVRVENKFCCIQQRIKLRMITALRKCTPLHW